MICWKNGQHLFRQTQTQNELAWVLPIIQYSIIDTSLEGSYVQLTIWSYHTGFESQHHLSL